MGSILERLELISSHEGLQESDENPATKDSAIEQLEVFYQELEYLNKNFPAKSIREVVDLAIKYRQLLIDKKKKVREDDVGFVTAEQINLLEDMTPTLADGANYGVIEVDDTGHVLIYNTYEENLSGISRNQAFGKNFFLEVAPCTNNKLFKGRFLTGVSESKLEVSFFYTFTYKMKPNMVAVVLFRTEIRKRNFILLKRNKV